MSHAILHALHVFLVSPFVIYVGLARESMPDAVYATLLGLGCFILAYHGYKAFLKLQEGQSAWINWIHIFLVAPLFIILGYLKKSASRRYYEMMLLLGFATLGYHGLYLIRDSIVA
jgi:hypothetical protein